MKILNFIVVEILSALLDKSKTQTIRPAWRTFREIPPRFKVADKVRIMWNQRSKNNHFCCFCGKSSHIGDRNSDLNCITAGSFEKHLGNAEITEVFKIEMKVYPDKNGRVSWYSKAEGITDIQHLAKLDGFASVDAMFNFFDKKYDLSQPKAFWVYRWKWDN